MKSVFRFIVLVLFLLTLSAPAFAAKPTGSGDGKPTGTPAATGKSAAAEQKKIEVRKTVMARIIGKFRQRLDRYQDFLNKVVARRDKLTDQGEATRNLDSFIGKARANIRTAKTAIDNLEIFVKTFDFSRPTGEVVKDLHAEITKVRTAFTDMHTSMSQAVKEIRNLSTTKE